MFDIAWAVAGLYLFDQLMRPLQTLSNVVAALREDDFSFRARGARRGDSLGDLALEINALAATLQAQRVSARDALSLLERVMGAMPSPVLAFGADGRLRLLNKAAEQVFSLAPRKVIGKKAADLGLEAVLELQDEAIFSHARRPQSQRPPELLENTPSSRDARAPAPGGHHPASSEGDDSEGSSPRGALQVTRWSVRRSQFRLNGIPHTLLVLSDVAAALREEERMAWQRLIRVLSHEINNSLTPIKSIAQSLEQMVKVEPASPLLRTTRCSPTRMPQPM